MIFIFLGPPGSGKGTQAALIAKNYGINTLSTGDVLRAKAAEDTEPGRQLRQIMQSGYLVPGQLVNQLVAEALSELGSKDIILDGYPRTIEQAHFLAQNVPFEQLVLYFDIQDDLLIKRLTGRFSCAHCKKIYNEHFAKLKHDNTCDICGSKEFVRREDDNPETVTNRLTQYRSETAALIKYYTEQNVLHHVDAEVSVDDIYAKVSKLVKNSLT